MLLLKRASKSRPDGQWSDDDYDVFDSDRHIGRILKIILPVIAHRGSGKGGQLWSGHV